MISVYIRTLTEDHIAFTVDAGPHDNGGVYLPEAGREEIPVTVYFYHNPDQRVSVPLLPIHQTAAGTFADNIIEDRADLLALYTAVLALALPEEEEGSE